MWPNQHLLPGHGAHITQSPGAACSHLHQDMSTDLPLVPTCCLWKAAFSSGAWWTLSPSLLGQLWSLGITFPWLQPKNCSSLLSFPCFAGDGPIPSCRNGASSRTLSYVFLCIDLPQEQGEAPSPLLWKLSPEEHCADTSQLVPCWTPAPALYWPETRVSGNAACVAGWTCSTGLHLCYYQREGLLLSAVRSQKIIMSKVPIFMSRTDPCLIRCLQKTDQMPPALLSADGVLPKEISSLVFPKSSPFIIKPHIGPCGFVLSLQKLVAS